ncbi:MAG: hypothetical protein JWO30_4237 [Fibrobacteres bacterium]|nr:hypothetical protein [Fibrobacterota bacterium]
MEKKFTGDLDALLKDVPACNARFADSALILEGGAWPSFPVEGLALRRAAFTKVAFTGGRIAKSTFTDCRFAKAVFDSVEFQDVEFVGCSFRDIDYRKASFTDCRFRNPTFSGKKFRGVYMGGCLLEKPVFDGPDLQDIEYNGSIITHVTVRPGWFLKGYEVPNLTFRNSTFDLGRMSGNFGLWGTQDCIVRNLHTKGEFSLGGRNSNLTVTNIRARIIQLNNGGRYENCRFEGLEARDGYLDKASFKNCVFKDFTAKEFLRMDSTGFEDVTWENAKLGPKAEFSAKETPYKDKPPF